MIFSEEKLDTSQPVSKTLKDNNFDPLIIKAV